MESLWSRAGIDVPVTPALPSPTKLRVPRLEPGFVHAGLVDVVVDEVAVESVGITGSEALGPTVPVMGNTLGTGTGGVEPTARLPISKDPKGIPVRAPPPGVVGNVDVGLDDAAILPEPEPHIPDIPDVSRIPGDPEVTGSSGVTVIGGNVVVPEVVVVVGVAVVPEPAAVAGAAVPTAIPPPSKLALDPNISVGEVATVVHAVELVVVGIVIVPVTPVGTGLTPGDVISVLPSGIPVGELVEPAEMPRGEVAPIVGVGVTVPSNGTSTCAMAGLPTKSAGSTAAISRSFVGALGFPAEAPRQAPTSIIATGSFAVKLSDIGQSWVTVHEALKTSAAADAQFLVQRFVQFLLFRVELRKPPLLRLARWRARLEIVGARLHVNGRRFGRRRGC
jgi:hypothetical protein